MQPVTDTLITSIEHFDEHGRSIAIDFDPPVEVYDLGFMGGAIMWVGFPTVGRQVRIELSWSERIVLIEALGGKPTYALHSAGKSLRD